MTTPLLLLDLLLTAGLPWPSILWVTFLDEVMVVSGLIGALVKTRYKWGVFALPGLESTMYSVANKCSRFLCLWVFCYGRCIL